MFSDNLQSFYPKFLVTLFLPQTSLIQIDSAMISFKLNIYEEEVLPTKPKTLWQCSTKY